MKGIIEVDLDEPQEARNYRAMLSVQDYQLALWDIKQHLRSLLKYENILHDGYLTDTEDVVVEHIQDKLIEILDDYKIRQELEEL